MSPGTCVIQDAGYRNAYPDLQFTPAAALLTRVVSRPSRDTFTLDLGCKAVATDPQPERAEIVGMEYARTVIQNEEHWVVRAGRAHRRHPAHRDRAVCHPDSRLPHQRPVPGGPGGGKRRGHRLVEGRCA